MQVFILVLSVAIIALLIYAIYILLYSIVLGAPYAATRNVKVQKMIKLLDLKRGDRFADLGSGDGRFVIAAAKKGVEAHGYELNPILVLISRYKIKREKLSNAKIYRKSYWSVSLEKYNAISVFGIKHIMPFLEKKLKKELRTKSRVASNHFKFPNWEEKRKIENLYLYEVKK